jgi:hypothetical protein
VKAAVLEPRVGPGASADGAAILVSRGSLALSAAAAAELYRWISPPMKIDITQMSEQDLIALNRQIVERLRFLQQTRAHAKMLEFRLGDHVSFQPDGRPPLFGVLVRYNKKTVTVLTEGGEQWNVSPILIRRVIDISPSSEAPNIVHRPKK